MRFLVILMGLFSASATIAAAADAPKIDLTTPILDAGKPMFMNAKGEVVETKCASDCTAITMGWVIGQALMTKVCSVVPGAANNPACTPEERAAENDPLKMWGRQNFADALQHESTVTLGPQSIVELKNLIAARFPFPSIITQVFPAIDPTAKPEAWGDK